MKFPSLDMSATVEIEVDLSAAGNGGTDECFKVVVNRLSVEARLQFSALSRTAIYTDAPELKPVAQANLDSFLLGQIVGWSGVEKEGKPLPFSRGLLNQWVAADFRAHRRICDAVDNFYYDRPSIEVSPKAKSEEKKPQADSDADLAINSSDGQTT